MKMKKPFKRIFALALSVMMLCGIAVNAFAADTAANSVIDTTKKGSITIYKYDITSIENSEAPFVLGNFDGKLKDYVAQYGSDGLDNAALRAGLVAGEKNLGNGETGYGYALKGVEFSYLKVADFFQWTHKVNVAAEGADPQYMNYTELVYGIAKNDALLGILGLDANDAEKVDATNDGADANLLYFKADTLNAALTAATAATSVTATKNALEAYMENAAKFAETDATGATSKDNLALGLYLIVETKVPEMVTASTIPFFVSVPMTTVNGTVADNGGQEWLYDVTVFPKNETGAPTLEKTVREAKADTGLNNSSAAIDDGYAHTATASEGDVVEYQYISKLPAITSNATNLTNYQFTDKMQEGLEYIQNSVELKFYSDAACTQEKAEATFTKGTDYTVTFTAAAEGYVGMKVELTAAGLAKVNANSEGIDAANYSEAYLRVTYSANVTSTDKLVLGDEGNTNEVTLQWKRTNEAYFDQLIDDCHVYSYGIDLTKEFSDGHRDFSMVEFKLQNATDAYWVAAEEDAENPGVYYVTGHKAEETDATKFVPSANGVIIINGLENDTYTLTETQTANGYTLLKEPISVVITAQENANRACNVYGKDLLGEVNNHEHYLLTASATVDGNAVTMENDKNNATSPDALVALKVINNKGFNLPKTGEDGTLMFGVIGVLGLAALAVVMFFVFGKKKSEEDAA